MSDQTEPGTRLTGDDPGDRGDPRAPGSPTAPHEPGTGVVPDDVEMDANDDVLGIGADGATDARIEQKERGGP